METAWWRSCQRGYRRRRSVKQMALFTAGVVIVAALVGWCVSHDEREMAKDIAELTAEQKFEILTRAQRELFPGRLP